MGFGENTQASLITRGLAEMTRLGRALGADPATFSGLSGMGDLIVTCMSRLSRNWSVGYRVGQGESVAQVLVQRQVEPTLGVGHDERFGVYPAPGEQGIQTPRCTLYGVHLPHLGQYLKFSIKKE